MEYKISQENLKKLFDYVNEIPTKYGRQIQDFLNQNLVEIKKEEEKDEQN